MGVVRTFTALALASAAAALGMCCNKSSPPSTVGEIPPKPDAAPTTNATTTTFAIDAIFLGDVDPLTDTPERLKTWGAKFKAGPGWTFVTGNKEEIDRLLRALGTFSARREDHTPSVIIGNDARDVWTRTYGLASASQMIGVINEVIGGSYANTN